MTTDERYHGKNLIHSLKQIGEEYWISMEDHRRILAEERAEVLEKAAPYIESLLKYRVGKGELAVEMFKQYIEKAKAARSETP